MQAGTNEWVAVGLKAIPRVSRMWTQSTFYGDPVMHSCMKTKLLKVLSQCRWKY